MNDNKFIEVEREVVLHNTETLLKKYKRSMNKMDSKILHKYGDVIFDLLEKLTYFEDTGGWY